MNQVPNSENPTEQLEIIDQNITGFRNALVSELTAATKPLTPLVAFKVLSYREALSWRTIELASGALEALKTGNVLTGLIATRSVLECSAAHSYLLNKLKICVKADSVNDLNDVTMRLLLGAKWKDWEQQPMNVLTMLDKAESEFPGIRKNYDSLSEYSHPNISGTFQMFAMHRGKFDLTLGRYPRGHHEPLKVATNSLIGALMLFEECYNGCTEYLPKIVTLCARDLEENF